jgi:predicted metal-dependent peptidase
MEQPNLEQMVSASVLRLRMRSPFFATLALFARFRPSDQVPTAATDGRDVFYNPTFLAGLPQRQLDAVLLHEVLHAALLHAVRRGARDQVLWNLAADIVVNGMIAAQDFVELPPNSVREKSLEDKQVEEIYELLHKRKDLKLPCQCLNPPGVGSGDGQDDIFRRLSEVEAYWRNALRHAEVIQRSFGQGKMPAGLERLLKSINESQLDWRSQLWRFLVKTPTDFASFDRRFVGRGLYLEALEGESVRVYVAVDTSGSVDDQQLSTFLGEVQGILGAYPHLEAELYYADAALYGPFPLKPGEPFAKPQGGGGTSFEPFFAKIEEHSDLPSPVCSSALPTTTRRAPLGPRRRAAPGALEGAHAQRSRPGGGRAGDAAGALSGARRPGRRARGAGRPKRRGARRAPRRARRAPRPGDLIRGRREPEHPAVGGA